MDKPVVYFTGEARYDDMMFKGVTVAHVRTLDHYVWGADKVRTSKVLNVFPDGSFETMNTLYKPAHLKEAANG